MTFGERLTYIRQRRGLTQTEVARRTGVSRVTICGYEKDRREPTLFNAVALAEVLNVSLKYLATGENHEKR